MKRIEINTNQNENHQANNNGFSFPDFSGSTNQNYYSSQTSDSTVSIQNHQEPSLNKYTICLDWVEFICTWENPIETTYLENQNQRIRVEKISVHKNPNFRNLHRIYYDGVEVCDIYSGTNNGAHKYNEVSIKIANHQLYSSNYPETIRKLLSAFKLTFTRFARWDIALDGQDIRIINETLNKFVRSHTVQINNDSIKIAATAFNKKNFDGKVG